tara:strand:+ start:3058 stop:3462 length:405 start_codon:yes stop_codon:yes gene_type:complete
MIDKKTLSVDASFSSKTGIMEYRGLWTDTGVVYFHEIFSVGTNNLGEFLAIVQGIAQMKKDGINKDIYTDSNTAMAWVRNKKVNTNLVYNKDTSYLWDVIGRAESWLKSNNYDNSLIKWKTKEWGEIIADFDRK